MYHRHVRAWNVDSPSVDCRPPSAHYLAHHLCSSSLILLFNQARVINTFLTATHMWTLSWGLLCLSLFVSRSSNSLWYNRAICAVKRIGFLSEQRGRSVTFYSRGSKLQTKLGHGPRSPIFNDVMFSHHFLHQAGNSRWVRRQSLTVPLDLSPEVPRPHSVHYLMHSRPPYSALHSPSEQTLSAHSCSCKHSRTPPYISAPRWKI